MHIHDAAMIAGKNVICRFTITRLNTDFCTVECVQTRGSIRAYVFDSLGRASGAVCAKTHPSPVCAALLEALSAHPARASEGDISGAYAVLMMHFRRLPHGAHDADFCLGAQLDALSFANFRVMRAI